MKKKNYSVWTGFIKTAKNSAWTLIPFVLALLAQVPVEYAWIATPIAYFCKNYYANKSK